MDWLLNHLVAATLLATVLALFNAFVVLGAFYFTNRMQAPRWVVGAIPAVIGVFTTLIVGVIVGPAVNHEWAQRRDQEQRLKPARQASHLGDLKPVLEADARAFTDFAQRIAETGHFQSVRGEFLARDEEEIWRRHVLVTDFRSHFRDYFETRENIRKRVARHDQDLRDLVLRIERGCH